MKVKKVSLLLFLLIFTVISVFQLFSYTIFADEEDVSDKPTIVETGFEDGNVLFTSIGGVNLSTDKEIKHSGDSSLLVGGNRTETWSRPEYSLKDKGIKGEEYYFSAWVYQNSGETRDIKMTIYNWDSANAQYDGKNYTPVTVDTQIPSGEWKKLSGTYTFDYTQENNDFAVYFETDDKELPFYIDDFKIAGITQGSIPFEIEEDLPNLKDEITEFPIGVAVPSSYLSDPSRSALIKKHFNSITSEWEMKPKFIAPKEGTYDFSAADKYVEFAANNKMRVRGHTLIWHIDAAEWMFVDSEGQTVSREVLLSRMKEYITTVMTRYAGKIECWDVVNEAIEDGTNELRNSKWRQIIGDDYIEYAFKYAHEADPNSKLFYNDYNYSEDKNKTEAIYNLVKNLKDKGIAIDGVGIQGHFTVDTPSISAIETSIKRYMELGVKYEMTELDVSVYDSQETSVTKELLLKQGYRYKEILDLLKKYKTNVTGLTLWGLTDNQSWLVGQNGWDAPLLFDKYGKSKPAFLGLTDADQLPVLIQKMKSYKDTPKIDGIIENVWDTVRAENILDADKNSIGQFKTLWAKHKLYVLAEINDSSKNPSDSLKIYVDQNNSKTIKRERDDLAFTIKRTHNKHKIGINSRVINKPDKYIVEAKINLDKVTLEEGKTLGFDIKVIDKNKSYVWNDVKYTQNKSTANYGELLILNGPLLTETVKGTPILDGEMDMVWNNANEIDVTLRKSGDTETATGKFKTLWDNEYIYVWGNVSDEVLNADSKDPWAQDSVELFLDQNFNRTKYYESDDAQYRISYQGKLTYTGNADEDKFTGVAKTTSSGYVVEVALPITKVTPIDGMLMGFEVQLNDADASGTRTGMTNWSDNSNKAYMSTENYGVIRLVSTINEQTTQK